MASKDSQNPTVTLNGTAYRLRYDYGAMMELCDQLGATISNLQEAMGSLKVSQMYLTLWCGMLDQCPELADPVEGPKAVKAMLKPLDILDGQAVVQTAMEAFNAAMVRSSAKAKGGDADKSPPIPAPANP